MLEIIRSLSDTEVQWLRSELSTLDQHLTEDKSNYAKGRQRFWLKQEYDLLHQTIRPAISPSDQLWQFCIKACQAVGFSPDLGLIAKGEVGIRPHRDAKYADYKAVSIQIGKALWTYDCQYPGYAYSRNLNPTNPQQFEVSDCVIAFNCKNPHGAEPLSPDRYSINLWKLKPY